MLGFKKRTSDEHKGTILDDSAIRAGWPESISPQKDNRSGPRPARFDIITVQGAYRWRLLTRNSYVLAVSSNFSRRSDAARAARRLAGQAAAADLTEVAGNASK